jgi:succinyl-CoA:acetate CoA-transferase
MTPSVARHGALSCIVPMTPHVDPTGHDVQVIVTKQGLADLRGLSPKQRARVMIENCAHPDFKPALRDYCQRALRDSPGQHPPHLLAEAFAAGTCAPSPGSPRRRQPARCAPFRGRPVWWRR